MSNRCETAAGHFTGCSAAQQVFSGCVVHRDAYISVTVQTADLLRQLAAMYPVGAHVRVCDDSSVYMVEGHRRGRAPVDVIVLIHDKSAQATHQQSQASSSERACVVVRLVLNIRGCEHELMAYSIELAKSARNLITYNIVE